LRNALVNECRPLGHLEKAVLAVALSWGAGIIDAVGYLSLYKAFVAHMTGNTVSSVLHAFSRDWMDVFHRAMPIPMFFMGLMMGEIVLERAKRRRRRHVASRALAVEAMMLAAFLGAGLPLFGATPHIQGASPGEFGFLVAVIAVAMGVQSASLRKVGALTVFTTFITGTLTKLANDLSEYLFWLRDRTKGRFRRRIGPALRISGRQESFQSVVLLSALYVAYALGGLCGAAGFHWIGIAIAAIPLTLILAAIATDLLRPISPVP